MSVEVDKLLKTKKPCPFCGSKDTFVERSSIGCSAVQCSDCATIGPHGQPSDMDDIIFEEKHGLPPGYVDAIRQWNNRA